MGIKANLQMNFLEQFVQNVTYTYTTYKLLSQYQDSVNFQDDILTYQPTHQIQASLYWTTPFGLSFDVNGIYVSEQFRHTKAEDNRIGERFFLNVTLTQKLTDQLQIYLLGRNLTNTNIYDIIPILDSEEITSSQLFIGGVRFRF
jgi:outer membrane receptor for ferrienterochelin and colicin